jgi:hypothetical protein
MRRLVSIVSALALAALVLPVSAHAAKPKPAAWAQKNGLKGAWRAKDADRDGLKNQREFKLGTNPRKADTDRDGLKDGDEVTSGNDPRKADSDRDGVKDGAEHAGVVTAANGDTVTLRQFNGPKLTLTLDGACAEDSLADEEGLEGDDQGFVEATEDEWVADNLSADASAIDDGEETVVDRGDEDVTADDASADCDVLDLAKGDVLRSAEVEETDGVLYLIAVEPA